MGLCKPSALEIALEVGLGVCDALLVRDLQVLSTNSQAEIENSRTYTKAKGEPRLDSTSLAPSSPHPPVEFDIGRFRVTAQIVDVGFEFISMRRQSGHEGRHFCIEIE